ncbi:alkaline phosphatase family protein [Bdellovibrio sp. HCB337]|uniref:alkaline phosphatase family protein n=1 Tax=Bdellovibrio sp. HCB337 TaxID=3394358 RepID=UPI0039A47908
MRAVKASSIFAILLALAASLVQLSCQSSKKPSVLVIAFDDLSVVDLLCNEDMTNATRSGFEILCKESVRFTHAFNPSVLAVPTLSSIVTGVYPFQHRVRNNGLPALDAQFTTVAETALELKYRTAFFSGGAPVWRKSGLNQGFELFEDGLVPTRQSLHRPFSTTVKSLLQWIRQEVGSSSPFFAMVYAPDLIFTNTVTMNEFGEARNLSHESLLDELDSNLFQLFSELRNSNRWNDTTIVVVGLNGHTNEDRPGELTPTNLHSENTQVALFVKPTRRVLDDAIQWKVDRNVSLVDLGSTLFEVLGVKENPNKPAEIFPVYSLSRLIDKNQSAWPENRLILLESDWAQWRGYSNRRSAVLANHTLFLHDERPQFFNTLIDRLEMNPLRSSEMGPAEKLKILEVLDAVEAEPWRGYSSDIQNKYSPAFYRWMRADQKPALLRDLKAKASLKNPDPDVLRWTALLAFELRDWGGLKVLGQKTNQPFWQYVAESNGAIQGPKVNFNLAQDPCLRLLQTPRLDSVDIRKCDNSLFLDFIDWHRSDARGLSKDLQKRRFERAYLSYLVDLNIKQANLATTLIWDISPKSQLGPELTDLVLNLPEYQKQRGNLMKALQNTRALEEDDF